MSLGSDPNETAVNFPSSSLHYLSSSILFVSVTLTVRPKHTHTHTHTHTGLYHHVAAFDVSDNVELMCGGSSVQPVVRSWERWRQEVKKVMREKKIIFDSLRCRALHCRVISLTNHCSTTEWIKLIFLTALSPFTTPLLHFSPGCSIFITPESLTIARFISSHTLFRILRASYAHSETYILLEVLYKCAW